MRTTRRFAMLALVALSGLGPVSGEAAVGCTRYDPIGDVQSDLEWSTRTELLTPTGGGAVDLTALEVATDGTDVTFTLGVDSLSQATRRDSLSYSLSWYMPRGAFNADAYRDDGVWRFYWRVNPGNATMTENHPTAGSVDRATSRISIVLPLAALGNPPIGTVFDSLRVMANKSRLDVLTTMPGSGAIDYLNAGPFVQLGLACGSGLAYAGPTCTVLADPQGDDREFRRLPGEPSERATDLRSLSVASTPDELILDVAVTSLRDRAESVNDEYWEFWWRTGGQSYRGQALRFDGGGSYSWFEGPRTMSDGLLAFDESTGTIRIVLPRYAMSIPDGAQLEAFRLHAFSLTKVQGTGIVRSEDRAPNAGASAGTYVMGTAC